MHSCKKDNLKDRPNSIDDKTLIAKLGFDTKNIADMGDYYLVEGDIGIKKASLKTTVKRQVYFNQYSWIDDARQPYLTVRIADDVPSDGSNLDWRNAIPLALAQWNNLPFSNVRFTLVSTSTADITIHTQAVNDVNLCAFIDDWPTLGEPSHFITINTLYHYQNTTYTDEQKKWVMVHELGHALDIAHTGDYNQSYASLIGDSPEIDGESVFNAGIAGLVFSDFSSWDKYSIKYMYQAPAVKVSSANSIAMPYTVSFTHVTNPLMNSSFSIYPGYNNLDVGYIRSGTYNVTVTPVTAYSNTIQLNFNGSIYSGTTFNLTNVHIPYAANISLTLPVITGDCTFTAASGFGIGSSRTNYTSNDNTAAGYIHWNVAYGSSAVQPNTNVKIATFTCNRPSVARTVTATENGRSWQITFTPSGEVWAKFTGGSSVTSSGTVTFYFTYNM